MGHVRPSTSKKSGRNNLFEIKFSKLCCDQILFYLKPSCAPREIHLLPAKMARDVDQNACSLPYYELSQYTHVLLVITMSLSKVRKGLDEFRYAIKIATIDILCIVFP